MGFFAERYNRLSFPWQAAIGVTAFAMGCFATRAGYNHYSGLIMNKYRDKSALYGRTLEPGERPSWPRWP